MKLPESTQHFCLSVSKHAGLFAAGCSNGAVVVWSIEDWKPKQIFRDQQGIIDDLSFSRDGRRITAAIQDGTVCVWDTRTGKRRLQIESFYGELYSNDLGSKVAFGGEDRVLNDWAVDQAKPSW